MTRKQTNKRFFLNPKEGVAAASFEVTFMKDFEGKWPKLDVEASITISDCNRQISLEFEVWNPDDKKEAKRVIRERRAKLKRLKQILDEFVVATNAAYDEMEESLDEYYRVKGIKDKDKE